MRINLDKNFEPYGPSTVDFETFEFKGGEPHIKIKGEVGAEILITHRTNSFNDFGLLLLTIDAVKRMGCKKVSVFIPYFPAARQDRVMVPGEPLSVKVYANLLNQMGLHKVTVFDAHSEVTPALLENCNNIPNHQFIKEVIKELKNPVLISPDGGALKKIYKVAEALGGIEVVECSKSRDVSTGKLKGFKVYTDDLEGRDCLIVDDICDGGGTFLGLAGALKEKHAGNLFLAVSHGIFSKGFDELKEVFTTIFTTDSFRTVDEKQVKQYALNFLLNK